MRLLLTHGFFLEEDPKEQQVMRPYPPLGILYLSAYLRSKGLSVEVYDSTFGSRADLLDLIERERPEWLGIYGNLLTRPSVLSLMAAAREYGPRIVLGGPEPASYADEYLASGAEFIVPGEGDAIGAFQATQIKLGDDRPQPGRAVTAQALIEAPALLR